MTIEGDPKGKNSPNKNHSMRAQILSVDSGPDDLDGQVPFGAEIVRRLPSSDRPDYWLAKLDRPIAFSLDGRKREIRWIVFVFVGESIQPHAGRVWVGLAYVLDEAQIELSALDFRRCRYVATVDADIQ
jgi:hypothetical protein